MVLVTIYTFLFDTKCKFQFAYKRLSFASLSHTYVAYIMYVVYLITFMLMIHSYIYLLKRHRLRICQHVHLLLKIVLKILTFGC